jgi:CubicO group peptidase (beta-lactamase class C family)
MLLTRILFLLHLGLILATSMAHADSSDPWATLKGSPTGERVIAYLTAFNSGEPAQMRTFLESNLSADGKATRSIEVRLERYQDMLQQIKSITLERVASVGDKSVVIYATNGQSEWMQLNFEFEPAAPHYLAGIGIELMEEPPGNEITTPLSQAEALAAITRLVDSLSDSGLFSGNVLIAKNDQPILTKSVGLADIGLAVPNRTETKFNLGSINKIFTKTAIAQLLQSEKVRLDAPIGTYLVDYPNQEAAAKVTVGQLIEMTSGIGDFFGPEFAAASKENFRTNSDFIPLFANKPLLFEPGTDRRYSNGGYILLGAIIEAVTGQTYYQYVKEHIFQPAGMENSDSYSLDDIVPNLARGYTFRDERGEETGKRHSNIYTLPARGSAAGGGYSTVGDLLRFTTALRTGKLLDGRHTVWMYDGDLSAHEPVDLAAAVRQSGLGIAGGSPGVNAAVETDNSSGYAIIVLSNYDPPSAEQLAGQIRRIIKRIKPYDNYR